MPKLTLTGPTPVTPDDQRAAEIKRTETPGVDAQDNLDAALQNRGLILGGEIDIDEADAAGALPTIGEPTPVIADRGELDPVTTSTYGRSAIYSAPEGSRTAQLQASRDRRRETALLEGARTPFSEEEARIKARLQDENLTRAERAKLESQMADLKSEKKSIIEQDLRDAEEGVTLDPFTFRTRQQIEEAIIDRQRSLDRLNSYYNKEIDASAAARDFERGRNEWYAAATENDPSTVVSNNISTKQYNNSLSFFEDKSGVVDDVVQSNTVYMGLLRTMAATMSKRGRPSIDSDQEASLDFLDDPIDWAAPEEELELSPQANRKLTVEEAYQMTGSAIQQAAKRQGFEYDASPIVLGQEAMNVAFRAGHAMLVKQRDQDTGALVDKIIFDPAFAMKQAEAGQVLLPTMLKRAPKTPGQTVGFESVLGEHFGKTTGSQPGGKKDSVTQSAKRAAIILQHAPVQYPSLESTAVYVLAQMAGYIPGQSEWGAPMDATLPDGRNAGEIAASALNVDSSKEPEAIKQNQTRVGKSLELMKEASEEGVTLFPRFAVGNNSLRKYNQTRNANPTMFKEMREAARGTPYRVSNETITKLANRPISTTDIMLKMARIAKGQKLNPEEMIELKYYSVLYAIASTLEPSGTKHGDPELVIAKAQRRMSAWADKGDSLIRMMFPNNPNPTLDEINQMRLTPQALGNLETIDQSALGDLLDIAQRFDRGEWGYAISAYIDAALHRKAQVEGGGFQSLSMGQLDYTSAGLAFQAAAAGAVNLVKSMGTVIEKDPFTGEEIISLGPRKEYLDQTTETIVPTLKNKISEEGAKKVNSVFKLIGNDTGLMKDWGKLPMMVTPYGKHPRTHSDAVMKFINKPKAAPVKEQLLQIYAAEGKGIKELVDDLAEVHYESLIGLFGYDLMTTLYAIDGVSSVFAMGGESPSFKTSVDGGTMSFGINQNLTHTEAAEINGKPVPIYTGEASFDPTGRKGAKVFKKYDDNGNIVDERYIPKYTTAAKNAILAAMGHRSESIAMDEAVIFMAKAWEKQGIMPGIHNMYDSLSFPGEASLFAWYGMNVAGPPKAFSWEQRMDVYKAVQEQVGKTMKTLKGQERVNISYPDGEFGAIGFKLDEAYIRLKNAMDEISKIAPKDRAPFQHGQVRQWELLQKLAKSGYGWTIPESTQAPEGVVGPDDWVLRSGTRTFDTITGEQAAKLFNFYMHKDGLGTLETIKKWALDPELVKNRKKTKKALEGNIGKKANFAKPVTEG